MKVKVTNPGCCDETKVKVYTALNWSYLKNIDYLKNKATQFELNFISGQGPPLVSNIVLYYYCDTCGTSLLKLLNYIYNLHLFQSIVNFFL